MTDKEKIVEGCKAIDGAYNIVSMPVPGGYRLRVWFENGFGASIINTPMSYGNTRGLWELAVLVGNEDDFSICYSTEITDDVIGELTADEAIAIAKNISELEV